MKRTLHLTFFLLLSLTLFSQEIKIDSLRRVLETSKSDTTKLNTYNHLVNQLGSQDISLAERYLDSMINLSIKVSSKKHELTAYSHKGILLFRQGKFNDAILEWKRGLKDKEIDKNPLQKSNFLHNIAIGYKAFKEKDSVLKYLLEGIRLNESENNDIGLIANYFGISDYFFQEKKFDKASEYLNRLQSVALRTSDKHALARVNILLGNISRLEYDFQDSLKYFNAALSYYTTEEPHNLIMVRGLKYEMIKTKIRQKRYEESIVELKNLKEEYESLLNDPNFWHQVNLDLLFSFNNTERLNEGLPLYKSLVESDLELDETLTIYTLRTVSGFEVLSNRINDSTLTHIIRACNLAKKLGMGEDLLYCTELFTMYYLKKKEPDISFRYLLDEKRIRDSLSFLEAKAINLSQKRKFNEAAKEKENLALQQQNAQQALLTEKEKTQKTVMAGGLAVSLAALGIFFFVYRKNQKQKREIEKQKDLVEKLQRELHHRLKNNLSFIDFFITLAKGKFPDPAYRAKLDELQNRINSMFEVHKQLYRKEDVTSVNARTYISALVENVRRAYSNPNISLEEHVADTPLRADTSFPIGLIVNEFVTNSYKYAFPNDEKGTISIKLEEEKDRYLLRLSDTGKGLPADFNIDSANSFGMETIKLLTREYKGSFRLDGSKGLSMDITFPKSAA